MASERLRQRKKTGQRERRKKRKENLSDSISAPEKAHTRSAPSHISVVKVALEAVIL